MMPNFIQIGIIASIISGCSWGAAEYENHGPVKSLGRNSEFVYDFKYSEGCVGDAIKLCGLHSLQATNLVPPNCNDIKVLKGGKAQNGWAWITFECN
jgi:hypothetical protein